MRAAFFAPVIAASALLAGSGPAAGQQVPAHPASVGAPTEHAPHQGHPTHHSPLVEAEFAGSTEFRSGTLSLRLASPLRAEFHYFGVAENEIGMAGLVWEFRWGGLRLMPGAAWSVGRENKPVPVLTARWVFENERWISQGAWVQSLTEYEPPPSDPHEHDDGHGGEEESLARRASVLDGIHVSRRFGRIEVGPMIEHIHYREEDEWKAGGRVAVRLGKSFRLIAQVVGPGTEVRGGFAWER